MKVRITVLAAVGALGLAPAAQAVPDHPGVACTKLLNNGTGTAFGAPGVNDGKAAAGAQFRLDELYGQACVS